MNIKCLKCLKVQECINQKIIKYSNPGGQRSESLFSALCLAVKGYLNFPNMKRCSILH